MKYKKNLSPKMLFFYGTCTLIIDLLFDKTRFSGHDVLIIPSVIVGFTILDLLISKKYQRIFKQNLKQFLSISGKIMFFYLTLILLSNMIITNSNTINIKNLIGVFFASIPIIGTRLILICPIIIVASLFISLILSFKSKS